MESLRFHGCMPANLLPFTADLAIDEPAYRRHLRWLMGAPGVTHVRPPLTPVSDDERNRVRLALRAADLS